MERRFSATFFLTTVLTRQYTVVNGYYNLCGVSHYFPFALCGRSRPEGSQCLSLLLVGLFFFHLGLDTVSSLAVSGREKGFVEPRFSIGNRPRDEHTKWRTPTVFLASGYRPPSVHAFLGAAQAQPN
jgi:hypothetical protein